MSHENDKMSETETDNSINNSSESSNEEFDQIDETVIDEEFLEKLKNIKNCNNEEIEKLANLIKLPTPNTKKVKKHEIKEKPIYLKDFELKNLQNNTDEINDISKKTHIKRSHHEIVEENEILKKISEHAREYMNTTDAIFVEYPICETDHAFSRKITFDENSPILNEYTRFRTRNIVNEEEKNSNEVRTSNNEKTDSETDLETEVPINVSYPRKIEHTSRITSYKRKEQRVKYKENKLLRKKKMIDKVTLLKAEKKKEIARILKDTENINSFGDITAHDTNEYVFDDADNDETAHMSKREMKKAKRDEKRRMRVKSAGNDLDNEFPDLMEDYHRLDFEDVIDDMPVRFNYSKVTPNSYGLTPEEILLCDESDLNKWCSMKKVMRQKDEEEEKQLEILYKRRIKNPKWRARVLSSIYGDSEKTESNIGKSKIRKVAPNRTRLVKRFFGKAKSNVVEKLPTQRLLAYNLKNDPFSKNGDKNILNNVQNKSC